jgi:predicted RNA-binding Zn-ribbon protein involved in translation (DUF1610 family)
MHRVRITIRQNPNDPAEDLQYAARVRRDLWAHSPVEIDPDSRAHAVQRDEQSNAYFEFETELLHEVDRVLSEYHHDVRATKSVVEHVEHERCLNCGYSSGAALPAVCPKCNYRDIDPCPSCEEDIPRENYNRLSGDLFRCPNCGQRVRFRLNDEVEPAVIVEDAQVLS